ncbi:Glyoxalase/bleomycin resistance protein/dioxygenase [Gemmatirosa kalamazoonensis]|uniref:Glyoxalase/bleomycin resistance protein/dioxygenase n=2 Tax=Gemmatirosa kalamazoonensis TaxID=861299 RepID=W0RGF0_9BACT|nr:Glyoxalase/bleomycin resistance protein/dioxygenase [Gemmatirosa kalamazoonensis]
MRRLLLVLLLASGPASAASAQPLAVPVVGMTVSDMERAVAFYTRVLSFRTISDVEVAGSAYEHLQGVFPARARAWCGSGSATRSSSSRST